MIKVKGKLKKYPETRTIVWNLGDISGDEVAKSAIDAAADLRRNLSVYDPGGPVVADWRYDPVGFAMLCLEVFEESVKIVPTNNEAITPPPCPEDAVC